MRIRKERHFTGTKDSRVTQRERLHGAVARRAAAEGMVLLENKGGLLPLKEGEKVALYGVGASRTIKGGTGSGDVNERESVSIYQGMKQAGFQITNEDWLRDFNKRYTAAREAWRDVILEKTAEATDASGFFHVYTSMPFQMPIGAPIEKTDAGVAFYILSRVAGEGADRFHEPGDYVMTAEEKRQLADVCACYPHVVMVVNAGGLVDLSFLEEFSNIDALLYIVQPGMEGGNAFADVVAGAVTPSGKLTDSWARRYEDYPCSATFSHNNGNVDKEFYHEGIYVGYRYFDTFGVPVRYSFGYGLSYTRFETAFVSAAWDSAKKRIRVTADVKNQGAAYSGKEVLQAYVTCPTGHLEKEYRRLAAFEKTALLAPGQSQRVTMEIAPEYLASYGAFSADGAAGLSSDAKEADGAFGSSASGKNAAREERTGWVLEAGSYVLWLNTLAQMKAVRKKNWIR